MEIWIGGWVLGEQMNKNQYIGKLIDEWKDWQTNYKERGNKQSK